LYSSFYILLFGRLLGGISTSCLHTAFESWYVAEHNANYFEEGELAITLSLLSLFNSNLAIGSGILADFLVRDLDLSPISPFLAAIPVLALSCLMIGLFWKENYGDRKMNVLETYTQGVKTIVRDVNILKLGFIQSLVESSMYTFVYLWTPTLTQNHTSIPLGRVFSCFMVAIMIGSFIFRKLVAKMCIEYILLLAISLFFTSNLLATILCNSGIQELCLLSFIGIELALGIYFPAIGTLRGFLVPENQRSTVVNLFRIPLNILTVLALLMVKSGSTDRQQIFKLTSLELTIAVALAYTMLPKNTESQSTISTAVKQPQADTIKIM
jgi:MFS family permease